jgi:hypothetical protein
VHVIAYIIIFRICKVCIIQEDAASVLCNYMHAQQSGGMNHLCARKRSLGLLYAPAESVMLRPLFARRAEIEMRKNPERYVRWENVNQQTHRVSI